MSKIGSIGGSAGRYRRVRGKNARAIVRKTAPTVSVEKKIGYSATDNTLILDLSTATDETNAVTSTPRSLKITNTGDVPAYAILSYTLWTSASADSDTNYHVHYLLSAGQTLNLPTTRGLISDTEIEPLNGTVVTDEAPADRNSGNLYVDSGATLAENVEDSDTEFNVNDGDYFRDGDLIQVGINTTTATRIEIMRVVTVATNNLIVERALYGTSAADKDAQTNGTSGAVSGAKVYFPFFNAAGNEYNSFSTSCTDNAGRYHITNAWGRGRAATKLSGILAGSLNIQFREAGYQNLTKLGNLTANTDSGLTAITYYLSVSIDGGTTDKITFTMGSNLNVGGSGGLIYKLQEAIDALYSNPAKNGFGKKAKVELIDGNIRVTSGQRLATSAISVTTNTDGTSGTDELFDTSNAFGVFPATIPSAVATRYAPKKTYDSVTYESAYNTKDFLYDDGEGNIFGEAGNGEVNYESGEIKFTAYPTSDFRYSFIHTGAFTGKASATDADKKNQLNKIYGNITSQNWSGSIKVEGD
tara:strand:+ start:3120 stop:4706 length:1587 start_codon:yes stop_codon:yes gene_type:complete